MKFEEFIIGMLVFTVVVSALTLWVVDTNTRYAPYGVNISTSLYGQEYSNTSTINTIINTGDNQVLGSSSTEDSSSSMIKGSYSALKLVRLSYSTLYNVLNSIAITLHIPTFIVTAAIAAFIVTLVMGVVYLVFGRGLQ